MGARGLFWHWRTDVLLHIQQWSLWPWPATVWWWPGAVSVCCCFQPTGEANNADCGEITMQQEGQFVQPWDSYLLFVKSSVFFQDADSYCYCYMLTKSLTEASCVSFLPVTLFLQTKRTHNKRAKTGFNHNFLLRWKLFCIFAHTDAKTPQG